MSAEEEKAAELLGLLDREPEVLAAALEGVEPGELPDVEWRGGDLLWVWGTLLTVAAARNLTGHMAVLLDRGWDAEGGIGPGETWQMDLFNPATPLSAAILGCSLEAIQLLLEHGAASWGSKTVCRTALILLHMKDGQYIPCIRAALGLGEEADVQREIVSRVPPHWLVGDCTPEELRNCLRSREHPVPELAEAVRQIVSYRSVNYPFDKLLILSEEAPEAFREPEELDTLLSVAFRMANCMSPPLWEERNLAMLERWRAISGPVRDISRALHFLQNGRPEDACFSLELLGKDAEALVAEGSHLLPFLPHYSPDANDGLILSALTAVYLSKTGLENLKEHFTSQPELLLRAIRLRLLDRELLLAAGAGAVVQAKKPRLRARLLTELEKLRREGRA